MLNGMSYANNSVICLTDIGERDNALFCLSASTQCCGLSDNPNGRDLGDWYFPDGGIVAIVPGGDSDTPDNYRSIFRNRGPSVMRLNRRNNATSPTGVYRCEIPDARGTNQSILVELQAGTLHTCMFMDLVLE